MVKRMTAAGIRESDLRDSDGYSIALRWASTIDETELARIERDHPVVVAKLRGVLARIEAV